MANIDTLTGLSNRRHMNDHLSALVFDYGKSGKTFTLAIGDVDFFKKVNDTYGHEVGDYVLATLARMFEEHMKGKGHVSRWGGEEFFFFFPDGNGDQVFLYIEHLRLEIEKYNFKFNDEEFKCTMTFGVSEYNQKDSSDELVQSVDRKLYTGKERGRNRVIW